MSRIPLVESSSLTSTRIESETLPTTTARRADKAVVPSSSTLAIVSPLRDRQNSHSSSETSRTSHFDNSQSNNQDFDSRPIRRMDTALDVLQRALEGDPGARSFLDQTASIYVLDATDLQYPKLFGCWNFLHQAMNEIERTEQHGSRDDDDDDESNDDEVGITAQAQLLAHFALIVARRSNASDRQSVATCIENYTAKYLTTTSSSNVDLNDDAQRTASTSPPPQLQRLIGENSELREIVIGRIAALAFDRHNHTTNTSSSSSDWIVLDTYHKVLAANAISNGPASIRHFLCDWIIPSASSMPHYSLASILHHLALEADTANTRTGVAVPAGTQDMLQQLSIQCMAFLLGPILKTSVEDMHSGDHSTPSVMASATTIEHEVNSRIAETSLRALHAWCATTDLSLAQVQHICTKVQINLVDVLNNAMNSESPQVVGALADLLEYVVDHHPSPPAKKRQLHSIHAASTELVSPARFRQTRFIMGVPDEASFCANITTEQLYSIETKELCVMLEKLSSAVAMQRFRFIERQEAKDDAVCHAIARIVSAVCHGYSKIVVFVICDGNDEEDSNVILPSTFQKYLPNPGCLDLLTKCASHPSVVICALALPLVTPVLETEIGLATQWLPILQRRAIIPHDPKDLARETDNNDESINSDNAEIPSLMNSETSYVSFEDFLDNFRATVLTDALVASYRIHPDYYLASCTAAIEEFCSGNAATERTSFHLEAALFCLGAVAKETLNSNTNNDNSKLSHFLERCTAALSNRPMSLMNPLTMAQVCHVIQKYDKWYSTNQSLGVLDVAADLSLFIFNQCATDFPDNRLSISIRRECGVTPFSAAAIALKTLLCHDPRHFLSNETIAALGAAWEATFTACNRSADFLTVEDRILLGQGICHVLASLPEYQRSTSLMALSMPSLGCLQAMVDKASAETRDSKTLRSILERAAAEVGILTAICRAFTDAASIDTVRERTSDLHPALLEPALAVVHRAWPNVTILAQQYSSNDKILKALGKLLVECLPPQCHDDLSISLLRELCSLARSIIDSSTAQQNDQYYLPVLDFLSHYVKVYGNIVNKSFRSNHEGRNTPLVGEREREIGEHLEKLVLATVSSITAQLGSYWTTTEQQNNGQSAYETKTKPSPENVADSQDDFSNAGLSPVLNFLRLCMERCPYFLMLLKQEETSSQVLFARQALDSAVSSLLDPRADVSRGAIQFLQASLLYSYSDSTDQNIRNFWMEEMNGRIVPRVLVDLIVGCACGQLNQSVLPEACNLLYTILSTSLSVSILSLDDVRSIVSQGLNREQFLLGKRASSIVVERCLQCRQGNSEATDNKRDFISMQKVFQTMMMAAWALHQISERVEMIQGSDAVQQFCEKYG